MSYFSNFPKLYYSTSLGIKNFKLVPNIIAKVTFLREVLQNSDVYYHYSVKEGEKPEDVAYRFYQDPLKHWIILLANEVVDPLYDWPISSRSLDSYMNKKYSSYTLKLNPAEKYSTDYTVPDYIVGEIAYQGSSIDASSSDSTVESYDALNHTLVVRAPSDVIANNSTIAGSQSNVSHSIVGITCNDNGLLWAKSAIKEYEVIQVRWNSYDEIKTTERYKVSLKDFNNSNNTVNDRYVETSESHPLIDGTTLHINRTFSPIYYYDYEIELNEKRRNIVVPKPSHISLIQQEFSKLLST